MKTRPNPLYEDKRTRPESRAEWVLSAAVFIGAMAWIAEAKGPFSAVVTALVTVLIVFALSRTRTR